MQSGTGVNRAVAGVLFLLAAFAVVGAAGAADGGDSIQSVTAGGDLSKAAPTMASVSPDGGTNAGGRTISIYGAGFTQTGTTRVTFGGVDAASVVVAKDESDVLYITCTTPAHGPGLVDVAVIGPDGATGSLTGAFTYTDGTMPAPFFMTPAEGLTSGGTAVTIEGFDFVLTGTTEVFFGGQAATNVSVEAGGTAEFMIHCTTPANTRGLKPVVVRNPDGLERGLMTTAGFTYLGPPTPTSIFPAEGGTTGGTSVTIRGTDFTKNTDPDVTFGGVAAMLVSMTHLGAGQYKIDCYSPSHAAGNVEVRVTDSSGVSGIVPGGFTYFVEPKPTSVSPSTGWTVGGDTVYIYGSGFSVSGTTRVTFGGADAANVLANSYQIRCTTPVHAAGPVDITVTNPDGRQGTLSGKFTYQVPPTPVPSFVSPNQGYSTGGEQVYIGGTGFSLTGTTSVTFGGVAATSVQVQDTGGGVLRISCTTPVHAAGDVDVTVTGPCAMTGTLVNGYKYLSHAAPVPTGISPASGSYIGGRSVVIYGDGFSLYGATRVSFGGVDATSVSMRTAEYGERYLTCTTPPHAVGVVDVTVINSDGQSGTLSNGFTYLVPSPPVLTSISPNQGSVSGGPTVSIYGTGFPTAGKPRVIFGGMEATNVYVYGSGSPYIQCHVPPHAAGTVDVTVISPEGQQGTLPQAFTYQPLPSPIPTSISPGAGPSLGGTTVYVNGSNINMSSTTRVLFDGISATNVQVVTVSAGYSTQYQYLTCKTPIHPAGPVDVTVINQTGESGTLSSGFTYTASPPPAPAGMTPDTGPSIGGTSLTITGTGFTTSGVTHVAFDGVETGTGYVSSDGAGGLKVTCSSPPHAAGSVGVSVVNPDGQSTAVPGQFTYTAAPPPSPTVVAPAVGGTLGGTDVTVTCTGLSPYGPSRVTFDGLDATNVAKTGADTFVCRVPAHGLGAVDVTVFNGDGQSGTLAGGFTYMPPQVTAVSPASGPVAGGTPVTITGSCFATTGVRVLFDGTEAGDVFSSGDGIVCTLPAHAAGVVDVTVIDPDGLSGTLPAAFTYRTSGDTFVRVDGDNASGIEDGSTWATAFTTIQQGIDAVAASGHAGEVWVAEGSYTAATAETVVITMAPFCDLYGGFAGVETRRDQRDFNAHLCYIDGMEESACVYGADNARLDGFVITGGNGPMRYGTGGALGSIILSSYFVTLGSDTTGYDLAHTLAVDNSGTSPKIVNCVFTDNNTEYVVVNVPEGALSSNPLISQCTFAGSGTNSAVLNAVKPGPANRAHIDRCTFTGWGTAIGEINIGGTCSATISRSIFRSNRQGVLSLTLESGICTTRWENCEFSTQSSKTVYLFGLFGTNSVAPMFTNCTFSRNLSSALIFSETISQPIHAELRNCIAWGNTGPLAAPGSPVSLTTSYCNLQDGTSGTGNISVDPLFEGLGCQLSGASPCMDTASAADAPATDLLGVFRPQGAGIDMGAYETVVPATVPDLYGLSPAAAESLLNAAGLNVGAETDAYDFTVPAGNVSGQTPAAGTQASQHSNVDLVLSLGPPSAVTVPDVFGMEPEAAGEVLAGAGLLVGAVTQGHSLAVPAGRIMTQIPAGGAASFLGAEVDLVVNTGATAIRVDAGNSSGVEDGTTWATAFSTIQEGIEAASGHAGEVWVAEGTYTADVPGTVVVTLKRLCDVYGGFSGVETWREERDFNAHVCYIDGLDESACVYGADNARLDGFTVTGGNGPVRYGDQGYLAESFVLPTGLITGTPSYDLTHMIAVDNSGASPTVANCVFTDNSAMLVMGNVPEYGASSKPLITGCAFADGTRSRVFMLNGSSSGLLSKSRIEHCSFDGASCGIMDYAPGGQCSSTISRCAFTANATAYAALAQSSAACAPSMENCLFSQQTQTTFQFIKIESTSTLKPLLSNCTIARNMGTKELLYGLAYSSPQVQVELRNCIVWGNNVPLMGASGSVALTASYCDLQEPWLGTGNISVDPLFDGLTCQITSMSPCADTAEAASSPATDLLGVPRPQGAGFDMGAYEAVVPVTVPDLHGLAPATAQDLLAADGLSVGAETREYDLTVPADHVSGQTPAAGTQVPQHSPVDLVISLGPPPPVTVPNVVGMERAAAYQTLASAGLAIGTVTRSYSLTVPSDTVISQSPVAGISSFAGALVDLVVSRGGIAVPNVVDKEQEAAAASITDAQLAVGTVTEQFSLTAPAGTVISQTPMADTQVLPGTTVDLVVSRGGIAVPNVVGETQTAAAATITAVLLSIGTVTEQYSLTVPAGIVISQSVAADTQVLPGAVIDFVVSRGGIAVPNVAGTAQSAATTVITGVQLVIGTVTEEYSLTVLAGTVISQNPSAGTQVLPGATVDLVVSRGGIAVPNVAGKTQSAATTALTGAQLVLGTVAQQYSVTVPSGTVISQTPSAGTQVLPGAAVDLVVSRGGIAVPNVAGMTQSAATTALTGAQLVLGTVTQQYSLTVPPGTVISQTPSAGTQVLPGAAVGLVVSKGGIAVPDVAGTAQSAATTTITGALLAVGTVTQQYSVTAPSGTVISQTPSAGTQVLPGTAVDLVVSKGGIAVPNVTGTSQSAATSSITGAQLAVGTVTQQYSLTVPAGTVISQSVAAGTQVLPGATIDLVVSKGGIEVPNVVGKTQTSATASITGAQLAVGTVTQQYSLTVPSGTVISQTPSANTQALPGATVDLVVSRGGIAVPNVVGTTQSAATTAITGALLAVGTVTEQYSLTVPAGTVISQTPASGAQVLPGAAVDLVVSKGGIAVPNVVGKVQSAATTALTGAGLAVGTVTQQYSATVPAGAVISQNPAAGVSVLPSVAVNLLVSKGPQLVIVPGVAGKTQSAATTDITGAGLVVGTVTQQYSSTVPTGTVISQNPVAGASVPPGTAVNLLVSKGPQFVTVPNLAGLTRAQAETAISGADLAVGTVTQAHSDTVAAGSVLSQNPAAGAELAPGRTVGIVVSLGPEVAAEGEGEAMTADAARQELADAFDATDTNGDGNLSFSESQAAVPGLTQAVFDELDSNADGQLSVEELGVDDSSGCAGCNGGKSTVTAGKRLGDLFLMGLGLLGLAAMATLRRP